MINKILTFTDKAMDYVPFISSINNIVDIALKALIPLTCNEQTVKDSGYLSHITDKRLSMCILYAIPILGNLFKGCISICSLFAPKTREPEFWEKDSGNEGWEIIDRALREESSD